MSAEKVDYILLENPGDDVEIRQYENMKFITVSSDDTNSAFSTLARYISGNNKEHVRISMTTPVISYRENDAVKMSFVLPEEYNSINVPAPENTDIAVTRVLSWKVATISFSGYVDDSSYEEYRAKLQEVLDMHGIKTKGDYFLMSYDPPWVPHALMRNEVAIEVE